METAEVERAEVETAEVAKVVEVEADLVCNIALVPKKCVLSFPEYHLSLLGVKIVQVARR